MRGQKTAAAQVSRFAQRASQRPDGRDRISGLTADLIQLFQRGGTFLSLGHGLLLHIGSFSLLQRALPLCQLLRPHPQFSFLLLPCHQLILFDQTTHGVKVKISHLFERSFTPGHLYSVLYSTSRQRETQRLFIRTRYLE